MTAAAVSRLWMPALPGWRTGSKAAIGIVGYPVASFLMYTAGGMAKMILGGSATFLYCTQPEMLSMLSLHWLRRAKRETHIVYDLS